MKYIHPINTLAAKPSQQSPSSTQGCSINPVTFRMFLLLAKSAMPAHRDLKTDPPGDFSIFQILWYPLRLAGEDLEQGRKLGRPN